MATPREIKKRIGAVKNTKQITSTMEMVSTAKSKKAVDRVHAAQPYAMKIQELIRSLESGGVSAKHPLLRKVETVKKVGILAVAANRGLCGGFNNNIVKLCIERINYWKSQNIETEVHLVGKKLISVFSFQKVPFEKGYSHIQDSPTVENGLEFSDYFIRAFIDEKLDKVEVIHTSYKNSSAQKPVLESVLPISLDNQDESSHTHHHYNEVEQDNTVSNSIYEPNAEEIMASLLPRAISTIFLQALLESVAAEHIARRIAMKNATDAASDMIKDLTREYNRVRQAKITQELSEIVAGADAIS
ncbi:MAG: ATP synthase F1 subunit gamma [Spirochaetia bacterium]|nr:ATP synthase F1 subunit gamma [Spirochaetia bacterium]